MKKSRGIIIAIVCILCIISGVLISKFYESPKKEETTTSTKNLYEYYEIKGTGLEPFDLYFLQLENERENKVYSPLSIKYALAMLKEGANGETKTEITNIIGSYEPKKYINSANMSFANALFIKDSYQNKIKNSYQNTLRNKYNADILYDSFRTPDILNKWVSEKTFNLINDLDNDISDKDFILVNALAIDMEWKKKIRSENELFDVYYDHQNYNYYIMPLDLEPYTSLDFSGSSKKAKAAEIGAVINKYDIVNTLGENNIRATVGKEYQKWLDSGGNLGNCGWDEEDLDIDTYLDNYISEISKGYNDIKISSDFEFYDDEEVKAFAKDLKTYNNTTLQYIGIMPKNISLDNYIKDINVDNINNIINNLKDLKLENFKEGVITEISGYIPMFKFDYEIDLIKDLSKLGITNIFNATKSDLSNLTSEKSYINDAKHKANIEFSNDGIKASAVVEIGGAGADSCGFDYIYDVPVEKIDLTFDKPYLFLIRDKDTKEVWFTGTVYEPLENNEEEYEPWW